MEPAATTRRCRPSHSPGIRGVRGPGPGRPGRRRAPVAPMMPHMARGYRGAGAPGRSAPPTRRLSALPSDPLDEPGSRCAAAAASSSRGGLDHHPDQRLGPARPQHHPAAFTRAPPRPRPPPPRRRSAPASRCGSSHLHVTQHLGHPLDQAVGQLGQRPPAAQHEVDQRQAGQDPVAGRGQVAEDDVAGLLAAEGEALGVERREDGPVADRGLAHADAAAAIARRKPRLVITVTTTALPGSWPRSARSSAKRASSTSPSTTAPVPSTASSRSASPSKARPSVGPALAPPWPPARPGWSSRSRR